MIHLNAFTQCTPTSQAIGQWKNPDDRMSPGYLDLEIWADMARTLERGCIDALFIADIHGIYDTYGGSRDAALRYAVQTPGVDPLLIISALALVTKHLGFACTYSTTYHSPYECARAFTSLDHYTNGRIGWNVVTSYMKNAQDNGLGEMLPHDERYERAEEYMDVVYKLWEGSWEDNAVVRDLTNDVHTDPARVHSIDHHGEYFSVTGPYMCEPSVQRTPVIYQAGSSPRGLEFGAKHAEAVFMRLGEPPAAREQVDFFRERLESYGRDSGSVKILMPFTPVVGETESEAKRKHETAQRYASMEGQLALFGGWTGIDLFGNDPDKPLGEVDSQGMQAMARGMRGRTIREYLADRPVSRVIGDPAQVVDRMEEWIECGVDGFIAHPVIQPQSHEDLVNLVVPELQKRGLFRREYEVETLRERYHGKGVQRPRSDHPAASFRNLGG